MTDIEVKLKQVAKATTKSKPKKEKIEPSLKFKNKLDEERFNRWSIALAVKSRFKCDRIACASKIFKAKPDFKAVEGTPIEHYDLKAFMQR